MGKPTPDESTAAAASPAPAAARASAGAGKTVIRAEPGKPWPEPPTGGTWSRNPTTGDLTLEEPGTQPMTDEERRARREQQRASAIKAAHATAKE